MAPNGVEYRDVRNNPSPQEYNWPAQAGLIVLVGGLG